MVTYIKGGRQFLDDDHFVQAHMLRVASYGTRYMTYRGYTTEIALPCAALWLYNMKKLNIKLEKKEVAHRFLGGPVTRVCTSTSNSRISTTFAFW